jgi:hypothetical protein
MGEIVYISSGDGLTSANMKDGEVPVFGGDGISGFHDKSNVDEPTIVIGRVGYYCGSVHVTPQTAWVTDNAFITRFCQSAIDFNFLVLLLKGTNLKEDESATAQPVISGSKIYQLLWACPLSVSNPDGSRYSHACFRRLDDRLGADCRQAHLIGMDARGKVIMRQQLSRGRLERHMAKSWPRSNHQKLGRGVAARL